MTFLFSTTDGTTLPCSKTCQTIDVDAQGLNEFYRYFLGHDAKFVTILRDPVAQYESMYSYYTLHRMNGEIGEFIQK